MARSTKRSKEGTIRTTRGLEIKEGKASKVYEETSWKRDKWNYKRDANAGRTCIEVQG